MENQRDMENIYGEMAKFIQKNRPFGTFCLAPLEGCKADDVQYDDDDWHNVLEDRLHPRLDLEAFACVGFGDKVVPAPSETVGAAEYGEYECADRQQVGADDEVPEIEPCAAFRERLEVQDAVAQSRRQGNQEDADTADDAAFVSVESRHFTDARQNIFEYCQLR